MKLKLFILIFICELFVFGLSYYVKNNIVEDYLSDSITQLESDYKKTLVGYNEYAKQVFEKIINKEEVLKNVSMALESGEDGRKILRDSLLNLIHDSYDDMKIFGIKQIHFHFPDLTSYLRMHRPSKFGDSLKGIRYSLKLANEKKIYVHGFEDGRIFNGFRYVYPLKYEGKHIGTVEIGVDTKWVQKSLDDILDGVHQFLIKKTVVDSKIFKDELDNYQSCCFEEFYTEHTVHNFINHNVMINDSIIKAINKKINIRYKGKMNTLQPFALFTEFDGVNYLAAFTPIYNVEGKKVAYFARYRHDNYNNRTNLYFLYVVIVNGASVLFLALIVFYMRKYFDCTEENKDK